MIVSHKWLAEYLGTNTPSPEKIEELFTFHAFEVEGQETVGADTAIDVKVLPNRGSDCLSHRGIARELATVMGVEMEHDPLAVEPTLTTTDEIAVHIADKEACPRFTAAIITGVTVGESPAWLKERLATLGQRSINNIVDATNYVMYAIGQPLHAYDADLFPKVEGTWRFGVRFGTPGEHVSLLAEGGKNEDRIVTCQGTELLIVDESSNTPIGLAGVKGGAYAGVHAGTKNVIIEAAHFDPAVTRKTARRLGIVIDASKRFENRPSPALPLYAQRDIIDLIIKIAGGTFEGMVDVYPEPYVPATVALKVDHVNRVLGLTLSVDEVSAILARAGITVVATGDTLLCTGPIERTDLLIPEDLIEEVARLHGFEHVVSVVPETVPLAEINVRHYYSELTRERLLDLGFSEVITSSFRNQDEIQLLNALATDKSCLRSSLIKNITEVLDKNAGFTDLLGTKDTRVFEIGNVFRKEKGGKGIIERTMVTLGVRIRPSGYSGKEDAALQEVLKELEALLGVALHAKVEKGVAEFDLTNLLETLPQPTAYAPAPPSVDAVYRPFSPYPSISRDIALWVTEAATKESVQAVIESAAGLLRVRTTFMDEFVKDGRTSYAFRLVFQADDRTLTDAEVEEPMSAVYAAVAKEDWEVR
jgi:phenylalanyl-tRNA synthetase beta chain